MLDSLSEKFENIFKKLRGSGVLTEQNISEALKEVRLALLEADVNFKIVKDFIERVREKAIGQEVLRSLTPGHQVGKVVWEELREMMGREKAGLALASNPPTIIMMVGLQGAGKTTSCGKLGRYFKTQGKRVLLVANPDPARLVWIPPGTFTMGSPTNEAERLSNELQHEVTISRGFWMGKYEVTQGEYLAVMGSNPSWFNGDRTPPGGQNYGVETNRPVEQVSWNDATAYCDA